MDRVSGFDPDGVGSSPTKCWIFINLRNTSSLRLMVRTLLFHGNDMGSSPIESNKKKFYDIGN